jgi:molybdopterin-guanine dinucleotide biosynthesis protein A
MTDSDAMPRFPAVILSGGRSSRMGEPKALLPFGPARLIDHVAARIRPQAGPIALNTNDPGIVLPGSAGFPDRFTGFHGPLAGIHAALAHVAEACPGATHALVVPTDSPFFPKDLVATLAATITGPDDIALAASRGRMHPVLGLWPVTLAAKLAAWLENPPTLKVRAFLEGLPVRVTEFPLIETPLGPLDPFSNINTPDDLDRARKILEVVGD